MSMLVADCPRCGAQKMTFDLTKSHSISVYGKEQYEAFCICRRCKQTTVFVLVVPGPSRGKFKTNRLEDGKDTVNSVVFIEGYISIKDLSKTQPPEHLPEKINAAFKEGAACLAIGCFNAACIMFRSCVDLATQSRFAKELEKFNSHERRSLGSRLDRLFSEEHLSLRLKALSQCIKDDGDDGAHKGGLGKVEARNMQDFAIQLLEELYTTPKEVELAIERTKKRRNETQNKT